MLKRFKPNGEIIVPGARFKDEAGKTFEVVEIIGDTAVINYETYGAQVVFTQSIDEAIKDGDISSVDSGFLTQRIQHRSIVLLD